MDCCSQSLVVGGALELMKIRTLPLQMKRWPTFGLVPACAPTLPTTPTRIASSAGSAARLANRDMGFLPFPPLRSAGRTADGSKDNHGFPILVNGYGS